VNGLSGLFANAFGGNAPATHFAQGGVISSPAYFANGGAIGLMGERGAEAVMPLARGPDGRLGVVTQGEASRPVSVTVNIAAQDIESFRRSEAQITGALARAVARGQRNL
jgi:phage-related minor tail protein